MARPVVGRERWIAVYSIVVRPTSNPVMDASEIVSFEPGAQLELEAFVGQVWQESRFRFNPEGAHSDLRRIAEMYQTNGGGFWLMRRPGWIVGTVAVRRLPQNVAEVKRLNVIQQYRRRGFGAELLRHALRHAASTGYQRVRLDTVRNSGPAVRLFERLGFVEIPRYNDNPDADLFMELDLRKPETTQTKPKGHSIVA